jgi:tetratricopeptide (TPR) repeat protein
MKASLRFGTSSAPRFALLGPRSHALAIILAAGCAHGARLETRVAGDEVTIADPLGADDHLDLGRALALGGDVDAARRELSAAAQLAPDDPRPDRYLGDALERAGRGDEAEAAYRRSIARRPTAEALNNLALSLLERGAAREAAERATRAQALALEPQLRLHIDDTLARARRAAVEPEAPIAVSHPRASPATFAYAGRMYSMDDGSQRFLDIVEGVPAARDRAQSARRLTRIGQGTIITGGCLLGTGFAVLFTNDNHWVGGGLMGGGALLIGIGAELDRIADRELDDAAALYNARVRSMVVPVASGQF